MPAPPAPRTAAPWLLEKREGLEKTTIFLWGFTFITGFFCSFFLSETVFRETKPGLLNILVGKRQYYEFPPLEDAVAHFNI